MTQEELLEHMQATFARNIATARAKNSDYADTADAFANFKRAAQFGITTVERGLMVRLTDKLARIVNLLDRDPKVVAESVSDSIDDAINYLAILKAWLEYSRSDPQNLPSHPDGA